MLFFPKMCSSDSDIPATPKKKLMQKYKPEWEKQCTICAVNFTIGSGGIGQIKQHQETQKHKFKAEAKKTSGALKNFLTSSTESNSSVSSEAWTALINYAELSMQIPK
ncbi:uncharacterized protein LOC120779435 isoform X2 [Bactrocera tryoni]|uniref:uncharacterized protein LOC120779435 isoform X2 n=1 Tax=Bactrocera tryoni TaxID=59916 RepID=UPI001A95AB7D|nr:uncharacterized protein LOC120779435 isoform X2 [Bactrocera tryoni]